MNNLKKLIILSIIPVILTIFFVIKFSIPSVQEHLTLKKSIKAEKTALKNTKNNIKTLKENKKLSAKLNKLNSKLAAFEVEFPDQFKDEILLIDLEKFANKTTNRIIKLESQRGKELKIIDPEEEKLGKKKRRRKEPASVPPVKIIEKPFEISTIAYYNEIIDFITFLENYQRKINIEGIYTKVFDDDKDSSNPKVELTIKGYTYKSVIN